MNRSRPFETIDLSSGSAGPHVLFTAGVHGDEFSPMAALRALGGRLAGRLVNGRATIVPVVNESAFRLGRREGDDGLDLARTCPGRPDGTVTERVAFELSELIRSADAYVDLHDGGARLSVLPMVGYMLHPNRAVLDAQRGMARAFGAPIIWGTDPCLPGRSLSVARDSAVPAIYAEHLGGAVHSEAVKESLVQGCLNVLISLGCLAETPVRSSTGAVVVEDDRPGSGHLQVQHKAPCPGYFDRWVGLGDRVVVGDVMGAIVGPTGGDPRTVSAEREGIVLALRVFPSVVEGDCLAVVLEDRRAD